MNLKQTLKMMMPKKVFRTVEPYGHLVESVAITTAYGMPAKNMRVIGVTGTNGKTTTCYMIHKMLVEAGYNVGLMTTVANGVNNDISPQMAHMTTVSSSELNKRLQDFKKQGIEWLVLETTSHSLAQHRVWGVHYEIAVLTNITHEHLDYHGTFKAYVRAKRRMFDIAGTHKNGFAIVNADDPSSAEFTAAVKEHETYGIEKGDILAKELLLSSDKSSYVATVGSDTYNIVCHIPGEFNVQNSLAAVSVGRRVGLTKIQIEQGIAALKSVEGRMMTIDEGQIYTILVDFAHTPDSFERLLKDVRANTHGKLVVLFGSAGRRDESKRAIQGEIAGKYADELILTEEDDRDIDGTMILSEILGGAEKAGKVRDTTVFCELDRTKAIQLAVTRVSAANDTVVFLGKGHEKTIERADGESPWDEASTIRSAIAATRSN